MYIGYRQEGILRYLSTRGTVAVCVIAAETRTTKANASRVIRELRVKGYVQAIPATKADRVHRSHAQLRLVYAITDEGRNALKEVGYGA